MKKFLSLTLITVLVLCLAAFPSFAADNNPQNLFQFEKTEVPEIYLTNQSSPIYLMIPSTNPAHTEFMKALAATKAVKLTSYDKNSGVDAGLFIISRSGKKMVNMRPGGIIEIDGVPYGTTAKQYTRLLDIANDDYDGFKSIAQWCAYMSYPNIVKVEYSPAPNKKLVELPAENVRTAAKELHGLEVKGGKVIFPGSIDLENWTNRAKVVYTFKNDTQYTVYANNSFLFIESKGMTYSCQYSGDYSAYVARIKELATKSGKASSSASAEKNK